MPARLAPDAPNVLIILIDDVGPATADTFGGEIRTPTLSRVAKRGVSYNRFHSTAMCSPTRAALLTGRNHTRVGNGQIAEFANEWDGFSGVIPKSSATVAEVLKQYGYSTGAWGKWHNTPLTEIRPTGPFHNWPTGYGFEYFYGFLAGESSQYEPSMVRNTSYVTPHGLHGGKYHLTEDIADDAVQWLRAQQAYSPERPFFIYWAPGAAHGPHQVAKEWADKYKGKFDDGWDAYRERVFKRQKEMGWIPANTKLTVRPDTIPAWDTIPEAEKPFQRRLMEVFAGFTEHADFNAGRLIDEIERQGRLENTLIFYIWGDNGSSAEGQNGTIAELLAQNGIPTKVSQHIEVLNELGGLDVLGSPKTDNMYHAAWAWAGSSPYRSTKLVAAHFGGTRQPMAVSWPAKIAADKQPRPQFHHVVDVVPTIYEAAKIKAPRLVNGVEQDSIDGISMSYTFADAEAEGQRKTQFFDIMASRGIYHDGWYAGTFGPRTPWLAGRPDVSKWNPENDRWELYNLNEDWSQSDDLAGTHPAKLQEMKSLFLVESAKNNNLPIGGGLWSWILHPEDMPRDHSTQWNYPGDTKRIPETVSPKLGNTANLLLMEAEFPENAQGVLYSLGGFNGGITVFVKDGKLTYEYNLFQIVRTQIKGREKLPTGKVKLEVSTSFKSEMPGAAADIVIKANGEEVARGTVPVTAAAGFTTFDCLDFGTDLGSPVSKDYYDQAPFAFTGRIENTTVKYTKSKP
jgi:arylsulfatase A-like enzyme